MAERRLPRGLLDPESQAIAEAYEAIPSVRRQTRGLLSLDPQEDQSMMQTAIEAALGFIPGVGQLLAGRDIERARRAGDPAAAAMAATEFLPFGRLAGMMRRPGPIMSELDVYHGSPHRFEEFDASKIGTGEGAQAYGHGIYLAESPDVARTYIPKGRDLSGFTLRETGEFIGKDDPRFPEIADTMDRMVKNGYGERFSEQFSTHGGALYTADLPDEMIDRMLDWDKPLSQQSPAVQKAVKQLMDSEMWDADTRKLIGDADIKGSKFYEAVASLDELAGRGPFGQAASEELARLGIPGIKYADAGSRGQGGSGTRNFVVFPGEEKKVKILERK